MKIAIVVPMKEEAEYYHEALAKYFIGSEKLGVTEFDHFEIKQNDVYLGLSGIGKVNAAMNLTSLLAVKQVDLVFMTGSAGSLSAKLKQGDIVLPTAFSYHDAHNTLAGDYVEGQIPQEPASYQIASPQRESFKAYLSAQNVPFTEGLVVTGDSFIGSQAQIQAIKANFARAIGVEMEGAAFAQVAYHFGKPLIALRAISDSADVSADLSFDDFVKQAGSNAAKLICGYLSSQLGE